MKVWQVQDAFGLDHLVLTERPSPEPGFREVKLRLRTMSLNFRDSMMVTGAYNPRQPLPLIPLSDGLGEVIAVGPGVTRVKVGQRVVGNFIQTWLAGEPTRESVRGALGGPLDGMLAEERVLGEDGVLPVPEYLSDEEGATLPCAAVTAWSAFCQQPLRAGMTVLLQGTGGVSLFALQLAKAVGARIIITSSSDAKLERAKALGAHETINYRTEKEWAKRARELTGGVGVDHVIEVGGAETFAQSLKALKVGGHLSLIGVLSGSMTQTLLTPILMQNLRVQGVLVGSRATFEDLNRVLTLHRIRPVVDRVFSFGEPRAAFEHLASGAHFGKVVVRI